MEYSAWTTKEEQLNADTGSEQSIDRECVNASAKDAALTVKVNSDCPLVFDNNNNKFSDSEYLDFIVLKSQTCNDTNKGVLKRNEQVPDREEALPNAGCESFTGSGSTTNSSDQTICSSVFLSGTGDKLCGSAAGNCETSSANLSLTLKEQQAAYELCLSLGAGDDKTSNLGTLHITYEEGAIPNGELCEVCNKAFSTKGNLKQHSLIHAEVKPFICDVCEKGFVLRRALQQHYYLHTGEKPYMCEFCRKGYMKKVSLEKHFLMQHGEHSGYGSKECLEGNMEHPFVGPYTCKTCSEKFAQKRQLKKHLLLHTGGRYYCDICSRSYKQNYILDRHLLTHTGVRPYVCDVCDKSFMQKSVLKTHYLTHTDAKPHVCDVCSKGFALKHYLKLHILSHSGAKPHVCSVCKKMFREKRVLKRHSLTHTGEKPFICVICKKAFREKRSLQKHSLREHSKDLTSIL